MFVLGRHYKLTLQSGDGGADISSPLECVDISLPLVKFRTVASSGRESRESIVNVNSAAFVKAELVPVTPPQPPQKPSVKVGKL
jgi:hypothetical protein